MRELEAIPFNEELLDKLGFTPYDDENCTWGNRRLIFKHGPEDWSCVQIMEFEDWPEENDCPEGFEYCPWFDNIRNKPTNTNDSRRLNTLQDFVDAVLVYRPALVVDLLRLIKEKGVALCA